VVEPAAFNGGPGKVFTLVAFTKTERRTTRSDSDRWRWSGAIPTGSIG
jgi:hypothetical protein